MSQRRTRARNIELPVAASVSATCPLGTRAATLTATCHVYNNEDDKQLLADA